MGSITSTFTLASSATGPNATTVASFPCSLLCYSCYNTGPAGLRLAFYDKATPPTSSDTPRWIEYLPGQQKSSDSFDDGLSFNLGLSFLVMPESDGELPAGVIEALNIGLG
jgi:hypothetical protein